MTFSGFGSLLRSHSKQSSTICCLSVGGKNCRGSATPDKFAMARSVGVSTSSWSGVRFRNQSSVSDKTFDLAVGPVIGGTGFPVSFARRHRSGSFISSGLISFERNQSSDSLSIRAFVFGGISYSGKLRPAKFARASIVGSGNLSEPISFDRIQSKVSSTIFFLDAGVIVVSTC